MANLTITVPDEAVARIREAMGRIDPVTGVRTPATVNEIQIAIKQYIKAQVINYETTKAADAKRLQTSQENWDG